MEINKEAQAPQAETCLMDGPYWMSWEIRARCGDGCRRTKEVENDG